MKYTFGTNINNSGESGIIDMDSLMVVCICNEANSELLLKALNLGFIYSNEEIKQFIKDNFDMNKVGDKKEITFETLYMMLQIFNKLN